MFLPGETWLVLLGELPWQCAEQNNMWVPLDQQGRRSQCWLVDALNSVITRWIDGAKDGGGRKKGRERGRKEERERGLLRVISDGGQLLFLFTKPFYPKHEGTNAHAHTHMQAAACVQTVDSPSHTYRQHLQQRKPLSSSNWGGMPVCVFLQFTRAMFPTGAVFD